MKLPAPQPQTRTSETLSLTRSPLAPRDRCARKVVGENLMVRVPHFTQHSRAMLAQADTMPRAVAFEHESGSGWMHIVEIAPDSVAAERSSDRQPTLFSGHDPTLRSADAQPLRTPGGRAFNNLDVVDVVHAEHRTQIRSSQFTRPRLP